MWCRLVGCGVCEMRVGCRGCGLGLGDFTLRVPNREPSSEEELGSDWPLWRDGQSRLEGVRRRMWGLLMMEPCKRKVTGYSTDTAQRTVGNTGMFSCGRFHFLNYFTVLQALFVNVRKLSCPDVRNQNHMFLSSVVFLSTVWTTNIKYTKQTTYNERDMQL